MKLKVNGWQVLVSRLIRPRPITYVGIFYFFVFAIFTVNASEHTFAADAYYYFAVARNVAEGAGSTFDGVSVTTGYHPLWLGVSTVFVFLFDGFTSFHYAISIVLAVLFVGGHMFLARAAVQAGLPVSVFMLVSLVVFAVNLSVFNAGLENTLLFFLMSMFVWMQFRDWQNRTLEAVAIAVVLSLIYFARLDSVFLIALYLPYYAIKQWQAGNLCSAVLLPALVISVVAAHLLFMLISFETIFPTSQVAIKELLSPGENSNFLGALSPREHQFTSRIMQVLSAIGLRAGSDDFSGPFRFIGLAVPVSLIVGLVIVARRDLIKRLPIVLIGVMASAQFIYYAVVMNGWMRPWYFTGWYILMVFAVAYSLSNLLRKLNVLQTTALILGAMVVLLAVAVERSPQHWTFLADRSELLAEVDTEDSVIVGVTPDVAGFFSGVSIRHLEGLMNGYDYLDSYLKPGRFATYLQDINATHYVLSNGVVPEYIPCSIEINRDRDGGLRAIGTYDRHNSYIAIYTVSFAHDGDGGPPVDSSPECGPRTEVKTR